MKHWRAIVLALLAVFTIAMPAGASGPGISPLPRASGQVQRALASQGLRSRASIQSSARGAAAQPSARTRALGQQRDWAKAPAIVNHTPEGPVLAVSDVHGHYEPTFDLFRANKVLRGSVDKPSEVVWTGKKATLVVVGDVINKGDGGLKLIDMLRALQASAEKQGGKVIVTLGNHEAEFLHAPRSERAMRDGTGAGGFGFGYEVQHAGGAPDALARGEDAEGRGRWLRELPFAARVGKNFFVHGGNTRGMGMQDLSATMERAHAEGGFGHDVFVGHGRTSVLGADDWQATATEAKTNARNLGVKRIIMGHIPRALDADGDIARTADRALVKLDTGFGNDKAPPRLLRIPRWGVMRQLGIDQKRRRLEH